MIGITADERTGRARDGRPGAASAPRDVLVFHLADQQYGIPVGEVQEIVPMARLVRSSSFPAVVDGFLNLAGRAVAVVPLRRLFGLPDRPPGLHTPLLVLRHPDPPLALAVDRVDRIAQLDPGAVLPVREDHSFNGAVEGMARVDRQVLLLLSTDLVLLDKEQQFLADFQDREQARLGALEGTIP